MAGRILPIALAAVAGVSIGVATFDGELKKQRTKKLEEEYQKEIAALASSKNAIPGSTSSNATTSPLTQQLPATEDARSPVQSTSFWSSVLGLWAWKSDAEKKEKPTTGQVASTKSVDTMKEKP